LTDPNEMTTPPTTLAPIRPASPATGAERAGTGIDGLDDILGGGLPRNRLYLLQGFPGVGKTTLALQFLMEGRDRGERGLYITLSESTNELNASAVSHGWTLDGIDIHEHSVEDAVTAQTQHTLFHADEVDLTETVGSLLAVVDRVQPTRIVVDSLSELRLLAGDALRYRREILALKGYFAGRDCTVMMLDDRSGDAGDVQLQSLCHGVLLLDDQVPEFGSDRRRLRVTKMRGLRFRGGFHDFVIDTGGLRVFPRLVAAEHRDAFTSAQVPSGLEALDSLFGGGPDRGTTTLLVGPSGTGKTSLATQYAIAAAGRGESVAFFTFDERLPTLYARSAGLGLDLAGQVAARRIHVQAIDPAELSPGEFAHNVRRAVEQDGVRTVVIDSLTGYLHAMPEARALVLQLHELLTYLGQQGVMTLMVVTQHGLLTPAMIGDIDVSYIADNVLLFRYYEHAGEVRQALSVFKRRGGAHERTIRRLTLSTEHGIEVGEPLSDFHGVLTGVPPVEWRPADGDSFDDIGQGRHTTDGAR
jgi:circadian clock protein KaiC